MIVPEFLKEGNTIGITAPSAGVTEASDLVRLENAKMNLEERGYRTKETADVRKCIRGRSDKAQERALEFMELINDPEVKYIVSAKGGDFLSEILPYIDFGEIARNPKWFQGFSDNTGLTYTMTTLSDIMTVYAGNFSDYGMADWHRSVDRQLEILEGKKVVQKDFQKYESVFKDRITGLEGFELTEPVRYRLAGGGTEAHIKGRALGGCLDVLTDICGTRFDGTAKFIKKYADTGIIWYLESFALPSERVEMSLWHLREAGWFDTARGFIFGRPCFFSSGYDVTFDEAVENAVGDLNLPIITGADIGHRPPRLTMINGAYTSIDYDSEGFSLIYDFDAE